MLQSLVMGSSVGSNTTLPAAAGAVAGVGAAALGRHGRRRDGPWRGRQGQRWQPSGDGRTRDGGGRWVCLQPSGGNARLPDGLADGQCCFGAAPAKPSARTAAAKPSALPDASGIIQWGRLLWLFNATGLRCLYLVTRLCARRWPPDDARRRRWPYRTGIGLPRGRWSASHVPRRWRRCCGCHHNRLVGACGAARGGSRGAQTRSRGLTALRRRDPGNRSSRRDHQPSRVVR
jgi:hypothetical protein